MRETCVRFHFSSPWAVRRMSYRTPWVGRWDPIRNLGSLADKLYHLGCVPETKSLPRFHPTRKQKYTQPLPIYLPNRPAVCAILPVPASQGTI